MGCVGKMSKIVLLIVEGEQSYVECLVNYLLTEEADTFMVNSLTHWAAIEEFLEGEPQVDLVLTSSEFYPFLKERLKATYVLWGESLSKYQTGEEIVRELLKIYASQKGDTRVFSEKRSKTKTIGIYSPLGGVGKTTLAVGLSRQLALGGYDVFYLNLEDVPVTEFYFMGSGDYNLSHVLYFLKEKGERLIWQIESAKCIDTRYQIQYFLPPDSIEDWQNDVSEELALLLQLLKTQGKHDFLVVDFSTMINKNNLIGWQACDILILVLEPLVTSLKKMERFKQELRLFFTPEEKANLLKKMHLVVNKVPQVMERPLWVDKAVVSFPWVDNLLLATKNGYCLDLNSAFGEALQRLILNFEVDSYA